MAKDLAEMEREFVAALSADTGRDLEAWMGAISASGEMNRNAIIDWLRQQGFAFPKASWLERIHHNGGKLIYADHSPITAALARPSGPPRQGSEPQRPDAQSPHPASAQKLAGHRAPVSDWKSENVAPAELEATRELLAAAKGLRPLAELILREIEDLVPGTRQVPAPPYLMLASPAQFAALLPTGKEIRLYGDFGSDTRDRTRKAEGRAAAPYPDVLVLQDARQIDDRFRELVAKAYRRTLA